MAQLTLKDRLIQNVQLNTPGALDDVITLEFYNVALDFLNDTKAWREDLPVSIVPNVTEYELNTASADITFLIYLLDKNNIPMQATMSEPGTVVLRVAPSVAQAATATVAYTCDRTDADGYPVFPEWIFRKYFMYLVSGVTARLMAQSAKPYSNPTMAVFHLRKFRNGIAVARAEADHANLNNGQAWCFPSIAPAMRK